MYAVCQCRISKVGMSAASVTKRNDADVEKRTRVDDE